MCITDISDINDSGTIVYMLDSILLQLRGVTWAVKKLESMTLSWRVLDNTLSTFRLEKKIARRASADRPFL